MSPISPRVVPAPPSRLSDWPTGVRIGLLGVAYFFLARVGLEFATIGTVVTPVWPASGLALGMLIVGGLRLWPGVWLGALATAISSGTPVPAALLMATGNTLEPVLTVYLLRWLFEFRGDFERPRHVIGFITLHALVGVPVSASLGVGGLVMMGPMTMAEFGPAWFTWWAGNFMGGLMLGPLFIAARQTALRAESPARAREFLGSILMLILVGGALFVVPSRWQYPALTFVPFPLLVWIAWSFGIGGAAVSSVVLNTLAIWGTMQGFGPFGSGPIGEKYGLLLLFTTVVALTSLVLAAFNSQRERVVERLRQREWQLTEAQRIGNLGVWVWDLRTEHFRMSDGGLRILGENRANFSATVGAFMARVHQGDQIDVEEKLRRVRLTDRTETFDCRIVRPDGEVRDVTATGALLRDHHNEPAILLGTIFDISDRKRLEAEQTGLQRKLLETQKLESLGLLAGGIAHDFNNLLTGILGNASLLRLQVPDGSPVHEGLRRIEAASERAADLCRQMLAYSGKGRFMIRPIDVNEMVRGTWSLVQTSVAKKAELTFTAAGVLPRIKADMLQMRQVLMNLVINASEALAEAGGRVAVRTGVMTVDRTWLAGAYLAPDLPEGEYVFVEVEDTGCGMTPEVQAKIFDPFYTTKFTGRGLGLAAVAGIVRSHHGAVRVTSHSGRGSTFRICFPPTTEEAPKPRAPATLALTTEARGTVLIVDDEETIRQVAADVLTKAGFQTVVAADGLLALEALAVDGREFRGVLLDFSMPRLDGVETFKRIKARYPKLPVVLMSGYEEEDAVERFAGLGLSGFVQKPFTPATLQQLLQKALG